MKKIIISALALLLCVLSFAQNNNSIYNKFSDREGVSAVYVSQAMFRMIGKLPDLNMPEGDVNLAPIMKEMNGMYILDCENLAVIGELKSEVERMVKKDKMELLLETKEDGESVRIYTAGDSENITNFVMTTAEKDEFVFIGLSGKMSRKDFEKLLSSSTAQ